MIDWQPSLSLHDGISPALHAALAYPGSLTAYLSNRSKNFQVKLLQETWQSITHDEVTLLTVSPAEFVKIREVQLCCDQQICVYARTLLPSTLLTQAPILQNLAGTSLGEVLFIGKDWQRSAFQFAQLSEESLLYQQTMRHLSLPPRTSLWARRSCFFSNKGTLLIYEVFLPAFETIASL